MSGWNRWLGRVLNLPKLRTPEGVRELLERAVEARREDLEACAEIAHAAATAAASVKSPEAPALQARALAELGNAHRVREELGAAQRAFDAAMPLLGPEASAALRCEVLSLYGSLQRDLGRFEKACDAFEAAAALAAEAGDICEETKLLVQLGQVLIDLERYAPAQSRLLTAARRLHAEPWDPDLLVTAHGNCIHTWIEWAKKEPLLRRERLEAARECIGHVRGFLRRFGLPRRSLELDWLEGRLWAAEGRLAAAAERLAGLVETFAAGGLMLTAAMVALDLAEVRIVEKDVPQARALASRCLELFAEAELTLDLWRALRLLAAAQTLRDARAALRIAHQHRAGPALVALNL
jgi:hypothetical protein